MERKTLIQRDTLMLPEDAGMQALELLQPGKAGKRAVVQFLRRIDLKKAGMIAGGAAVVIAAVNLVGQYGFYRGIVARELKKQLAPLYKKLDELTEENRRLREELRRLYEAPAHFPDGGKPLKQLF